MSNISEWDRRKAAVADEPSTGADSMASESEKARTSIPAPAVGASATAESPTKAEGTAPEEAMPAPAAIPPPPNGGILAWLQVVGAFFLFFNSWGIVNTFGVYQSYYKDEILQDYSASSISWIGTVQACFLLWVGVIAGPVFDKGHAKALVVVGSFLVVFGLMMTSLATEYYQVFLAHGACVGLGAGMVFLPSVAIVATYFTTHRALALGVTAVGGSVGSVIYLITFRQLIDPVGFGWTTRIIAFIALATLSFSVVVMRTRLPPPKQARALFDWAALKELPFFTCCLAFFFSFIGLYFPIFYLPSYFNFSLHYTKNGLDFYILAILNAVSALGRITPGLLADRIGPVNTIAPVVFLTAVLSFAWMGIHNVAGTIVFACLYGFASGALLSLPPTVIARMSPNMGVVGTRMGMSFTFSGLGALIGNPIGGALLNLEEGQFWKGQLFCAIMLLVGFGFFVILRLLKWREGVKGAI